MQTIGTKYSQKQKTFSQAINYINKGRLDRAITILKKLTTSKEACLNLGCCYLMLGDHALALKWFNKTLEVPFLNGKRGDYLEYYLNLGLMHYSLGDDLSALAVYASGLEKFKNFDLLWNYSIARLRQYCSGKYADLAFCWQTYEARFQIKDDVKVSARVSWTGGVFVDSITVLAEQGVGDNIMFSRYLPEVARWCNRLVVQCEKSANAIFSGYETTNSLQIDTTHCISMCSLGNLLDYVPAGTPVREKARGERLQIGCVWQSLNQHSNNRFRNTTADAMLPLAKHGDLYSLGPDCIDPRIQHLESADWGDTIEHLKKLDVVVTIDSAVANLCGHLGVPCYVLLPKYNSDWRWGDASMGTTNIWYPSVTVIRDMDINKCLT